MKASILITDDDPAVAEILTPALDAAGYLVQHTDNADSAFALLAGGTVDLLLLDVQLPGISGMKLLDILKENPKTARLPVIMLTLRGEESSKVRGLLGGADDYLVKPFSVPEVLARIEALLRRVRQDGNLANAVELEGIRVDFDRRDVSVAGSSVDLTPIELELLALLMRREGSVLTYQQLSEALSHGARILTSGTLYVHVKNLRRKLGSRGERIETVHGIGYKFARG